VSVARSRVYREDVARVRGLALDWNQLHGATVVVSGASGMIGSCLVDVLLTGDLGCTVVALARRGPVLAERFAAWADDPRLRLVEADVARGPVEVDPADYVIHAASNTHPRVYAADPIGTIMTNVQGTYHLLSLAVAARARRALFVSSVEIYGEHRGPGQRFAEPDLGYLDCNTLRAGYPESKRAGEALCQAFRAQDGLDVVIARLPRVYGPTLRADDSKALSQFLHHGLAGRDIVLKSDGQQLYSYLHVADAVSGLLTCLLAGQDGQAYNLADPASDIRLGDLARLVAEITGVSVVFEVPDQAERLGYSTATRALLDPAKIAALGWTALYDIEQGLRRTLAGLAEAD
jgi:nucleoside-diphosphate-sugar epimerase